MTGELQGLTADQVAERVREGKVNTLPERSGRTTWQIVRDNVFTRVNAMLAVLFVIVAATMQFAQGAFAILIVATRSSAWFRSCAPNAPSTTWP